MRKAADQGDVEALYSMGFMHEHVVESRRTIRKQHSGTRKQLSKVTC